jgi:glycosyltransferase 2 family protein
VSAAAQVRSHQLPHQRSRRLRVAAGPILSLLAIAAVLWWALHQQAPRWPSSDASQLLLLLAVLAYAGVTLVRGLRWYLILRRADVPASMLDAQALTVVGYMGNTVLPARGGELLRILLLGRRAGCSRVRILGTIVAERLLDVLTLLALLLALAIVSATEVRGISDLSLTAALALLALALGSLAAWRIARTRLPERWRQQVASLTLATRNLLSPQGLALVALTCLIWVGEGVVYWLVAQALHLPIDLLQAVLLVVLSSLAAAIPAAPGYLGTYDAAILLGLAAMHVHGAQAISFALLVRLVIFVPITIAGLLLVLARYGGRSTLRRPAGVATPSLAQLSK